MHVHPRAAPRPLVDPGAPGRAHRARGGPHVNEPRASTRSQFARIMAPKAFLSSKSEFRSEISLK